MALFAFTGVLSRLTKEFLPRVETYICGTNDSGNSIDQATFLGLAHAASTGWVAGTRAMSVAGGKISYEHLGNFMTYAYVNGNVKCMQIIHAQSRYNQQPLIQIFSPKSKHVRATRQLTLWILHGLHKKKDKKLIIDLKYEALLGEFDYMIYEIWRRGLRKPFDLFFSAMTHYRYDLMKKLIGECSADELSLSFRSTRHEDTKAIIRAECFRRNILMDGFSC